MDFTGISILCNIHEDEQTLGVCMFEQCDQKNRLVCFNCLTQEHGEHTKYVIRYNELNKSPLQVRNWPCNDLAADIKKFIQGQQFLESSGPETVEKFFDEMLTTIKEEIQTAKVAILKKIEKINEKKINSTAPTSSGNPISELYNNLFDPSKIYSVVNKLAQNEITIIDFNQEITDLIQASEGEQSLGSLSKIMDEESEKSNAILEVDALKIYISDIRNIIKKFPQEMIAEGAGGLMGFKFQAASNNTANITLKNDGKQATIKAGSSTVYSSVTLDKGVWEFEIEVKGTVNNCCLFGVIPEENQDNSGSAYSSHPYKCFANSCGAMNTLQKGSGLHSEYTTGTQICQFLIDFQKNKYEYGWKNGTSWHVLNGYQLSNRKLRFYINSFSCTNVELKLLKCKKKIV